MSDSAFCKRFRSFYESSPSSSPPDLPHRSCYGGNLSLYSDDAEDVGYIQRHEDPAMGTRFLLQEMKPRYGSWCLNVGVDDGCAEGQQRQPWAGAQCIRDTEDVIAYIDGPAYPPPAPPV
ncbi:hypothetical protein Tco_0487244 [Tanacetum coccineum]